MSASIYVKRPSNVQQQKRSGNWITWQTLLFFHASCLLTGAVTSPEIWKFYVQSNRQNNGQQEFLAFWRRCVNAAMPLLTRAALYVPHVHGVVYVRLFWKQAALNHVGRASQPRVAGRPSSSSLTEKSAASGQVEKAIVFSLASMARRFFSLRSVSLSSCVCAFLSVYRGLLFFHQQAFRHKSTGLIVLSVLQPWEARGCLVGTRWDGFFLLQ